MWNVDGRTIVRTIEGHTEQVSRVMFSPKNNGTLASCSYDGTLRIWSVRGESKAVIKAHPGIRIRSLTYSPRGDFIVTTAEDCYARVWDAASMAQQHLVELDGHFNSVLSSAFAAPDIVVLGSDDQKITVWDLAKLAETPKPEQSVRQMMKARPKHFEPACPMSPITAPDEYGPFVSPTRTR